MKKKRLQKQERDLREDFIIPQIKKKVVGINEKKEDFKTSNFVSPMFGRAVPDAPIIPQTRSLSDITKGYDTFREKPIGQKNKEDYSDFGPSIINNRTRKSVFGEEARIVETNERETTRNENVRRDFLTVRSIQDVLNQREQDISFRNNEQQPAFKRQFFEDKDELLEKQETSFGNQFSKFGQNINVNESVREMNEENHRNEENEYSSSNLFSSDQNDFKQTNRRELPPFMRMNNSKEEKIELESFSIGNQNNSQNQAVKSNDFGFKFADDVPVFEDNNEPFKLRDYRQENNSSIPVNEPVYKKPEPSYTYYRLPSPSIFRKKFFDKNAKPEWIAEQIEIINSTLSQFEIDGSVVTFTKGPTVTRYEIALKPGINVKKVINIQNNLKMALSAKNIRIEAPIPGKPNIGVEVPNVTPEEVAFGNIIDCDEFLRDDKPLKVAIGLNIDGDAVYQDISKMPHGLIAGTTGSGKSVCVNTMLVSLLLKNKPDTVRLMLIDPKVVELIAYDGLPHLITPVISDPKVAAAGLKWTVDEMENRYRQFADVKVRNIEAFNQHALQDPSIKKMPYIVVVIDELADLMMVASSDVEDAIRRLTQKSRACGIHLLVATQRPTTDVVKGTIKANIPFRLTFKVSSINDSVVALDSMGAETLLGHGDMLLKDGENMTRVQGAYISDVEIEAVTEYVRRQAPADYLFEHDSLKYSANNTDLEDELFEPIARFVVESEEGASINRIQREFNIGFNRAQRLFDALADAGVVSQSQGSKPRDVLMSASELEEMLKNYAKN